MTSAGQTFFAAHDNLEFEKVLGNIAERIIEQEARRKKVAEALAGLRNVCFDRVEGMVEQFLVKEVKMDALAELRVCGVDGGLLEQQLHGLDLILVRAIAAIFHYRDAVLEEAEYIPSEIPPPKLVDVAEPLDSWELQLLAGMERQLAEIELAVDVAEGGDAQIILLDGSVVPQYVERFPHSPILLQRYEKLIQAYTKLYQASAESGSFLVGAVKDSRGGRFIDILKGGILSDFVGLEKRDLMILDKSRDTVLLNHLLGVGERTPAFAYAEKPASYVLKDLGTWAAKVYAFYIKTVPFDRPLRVEFLSSMENTAETADRVASLVYALSSHHDGFGLPSVIIEADTCARLVEEDLCMVRDSISDRLEPSYLLELRRSRKPF